MEHRLQYKGGFRYTRHAKRRQRLYRLDDGDIKAAILEPDRRYREGGLDVAEKYFKGKYRDMPIKVVYASERNFLEIVSCYPLKKRHWRKT